MPSGTVRLSPPEFLQLLAEPHRWELLAALAQSDRRVSELTGLLGKPQNVVSYHLAELRDAGLVSARRSSADRRDAYYRVDLTRCGDLFNQAGAALHPGLQLGPLRAAGDSEPWRGQAPVVLFLCTGNSARSQMAEGLLEHRSGQAIHARSAGSHPKPLHPGAVRVMAEHGIDISGRPTKHLGRFTRSRFDRVITLCDKVREVCPEFPGQPATAHWSMPDPAAEDETGEDTYPAFQRTADELESRIPMLIASIKSEHAQRRSDNAG